ncbi:MAG TPA: dihydrofolate reductase family protein [Terrimicrobiaceae bacterium]|nr:dihydrofolate reductase family protein [Terrimicrobiaceae bacterium]
MAADLKSVTTGRVRNLTTQMVVPTLLIAVIVGILLAERVTMTAQITATPTVTVASITLLSMWPISTRALHFTPVCFGYRKSPPPLRVAAGSRWARTSLCISLGERSAPVADDRSVHLALTSDNLEPILQRLRDRGIPWSDFAGNPGGVSTGRSDGVRQIFYAARMVTGSRSTTVLSGDIVSAIIALKVEHGLDLQIIGSGNLIQTLQAASLIDEYNIWTYPVVLGRGKRLFENGARPSALRLVASKVSTTGVVMSTYVS